MPQQQRQPAIGEDVSDLIPVGGDVSHLMGAAPRKPAATEDYLPPQKSFTDHAVNFLTNFAHNVDPRPALKLLYHGTSAMGGMLSGDMTHGDAFTEDLKNVGAAQIEQFKKAKRDYDAGRWSEAVGHTIAGALPLMGPAAGAAGEQIGTGDVSGGLGAGGGLVAATVAPGAIAKALPKSIGVPGLRGPADPVAAAAVAEGRMQGVPLDAATATGRPIVATLQKAVGDSLGGSGTAERFQATQQAALGSTGEWLASRANRGRPMTPETAGQGAIDAAGGEMRARGAEADTAYGKLRAIEDKTPIPVDLTGAKAVLEPIYRTMAVGADVAPLQGMKANAVRALARILEGPDIAGASEVDSALSDLKSLARDAADTPGASAANRAVAQVHQAVLQAVAKAGPDALKALDDGRTATKAKVAAQEVRDFLTGNSGEPVQAYGRTVARNDTNIARVREAAKLIPHEMPNIGRAFLDDAMSEATADGGFQHARRVASKWAQLGDETKGLMFKPDHVAALDNFFRLAEKVTENVNPSGSGKIVNIKNFWSATNLATFPASWALSKLLYTERGVKLLTEGFRVPVASPTLTASYMSRLAAALKAAGVAQPAMATDDLGQPLATTVRR